MEFDDPLLKDTSQLLAVVDDDREMEEAVIEIENSEQNILSDYFANLTPYEEEESKILSQEDSLLLKNGSTYVVGYVSKTIETA